MFTWMWVPWGWLSLVTLTALEVALGVDNILFLTIMVSRLPKPQQGLARKIGVMVATGTRLVLLVALSALATQNALLWSFAGQGITTRSLVLVAGGLFLVAKGVIELRRLLLPELASATVQPIPGLWAVCIQIALVDVVFSFDSVFTALGLAQQVSMMVLAIMLASLTMLFVSAHVAQFMERRPALRVLVLVFMMVIGLGLVAEGVGAPIPRIFIYFFMGFSVCVESLHRRAVSRRSRVVRNQ